MKWSVTLVALEVQLEVPGQEDQRSSKTAKNGTQNGPTQPARVPGGPEASSKSEEETQRALAGAKNLP